MELDHPRAILVHGCKTAENLHGPSPCFPFLGLIHVAVKPLTELSSLNRHKKRAMTRRDDDQQLCANFKTLKTDFGSLSMERKSLMNRSNTSLKNALNYVPRLQRKANLKSYFIHRDM